MTVRVSGLYLVDGEEIQILTEGGSAKEAYAALQHEAEEIGGVVIQSAAAPAGEGGKQKRNRRTKAEMEAARAAAIENAPPARQPATGLPGPAAPAPMSVFAALAQNIPVGPESVRAPTRPGDWAPPDGPPAAFTDEPPVPQGGKTVGFDGPPPFDAAPPAPPPPSPEEELQAQVDAVVARTIALQPTWENSVRGAFTKACNGEQFGVMPLDRIREVLRAVEDYERRVKEALAQRR